MMEKEKKALYPPCNIGERVYAVFTFDEEPLFESYDVAGILWDGESWAVIDEEKNILKIGTDEAILDEGAALARFREIRDEYMKNKNLL